MWACEQFKTTSVTDAQIKCLIFVCGLRLASHANIYTRILSKIEQNPKITLQQVVVVCQQLVNLKHESMMVQ